MMVIRHALHPDHLLVVAEGPFDLVEARRGLGEALREAQARDMQRILVDARGISTQVSIGDRYELATQLAGIAPGKIRIAIVVEARNMFSKTMEDTARNRGVALVTTDSMQVARDFLDVDPA